MQIKQKLRKRTMVEIYPLANGLFFMPRYF